MKKPLSVLMGIALLAAGLLLPANPSVAQEADAPAEDVHDLAGERVLRLPADAGAPRLRGL